MPFFFDYLSEGHCVSTIRVQCIWAGHLPCTVTLLRIIATFRVARLTLQTPKLWLVDVATDRDARHACFRFFSLCFFFCFRFFSFYFSVLFFLLAQKKTKQKSKRSEKPRNQNNLEIKKHKTFEKKKENIKQIKKTSKTSKNQKF